MKSSFQTRLASLEEWLGALGLLYTTLVEPQLERSTGILNLHSEELLLQSHADCYVVKELVCGSPLVVQWVGPAEDQSGATFSVVFVPVGIYTHT